MSLRLHYFSRVSLFLRPAHGRFLCDYKMITYYCNGLWKVQEDDNKEPREVFWRIDHARRQRCARRRRSFICYLKTRKQQCRRRYHRHRLAHF